MALSNDDQRLYDKQLKTITHDVHHLSVSHISKSPLTSTQFTKQIRALEKIERQNVRFEGTVNSIRTQQNLLTARDAMSNAVVKGFGTCSPDFYPLLESARANRTAIEEGITNLPVVFKSLQALSEVRGKVDSQQVVIDKLSRAHYGLGSRLWRRL
ncbi:hypothetical protein CC86DRAFT_194802 [Ophiobolus disseminans]|uniref:Uncharacterized protein n=1 Tax=Ophiobolus disseminans TaxID=1469910 RepID=A0A6A7A5H5_9PLEO|nr:hypothetical protein CC86DRAFT_194802 [Ophiobolus disseminans]